MVYVDSSDKEFGRMKMCHMIADSTPELLEMARKIAVAERHIQAADTYREHFDICMSKRKLAVQLGAHVLSNKELVEKLIQRRKEVYADRSSECQPSTSHSPALSKSRRHQRAKS